MYIFESSEGEVGKYLAAEATCANDEDFAFLPQEIFDLWKEVNISKLGD